MSEELHFGSAKYVLFALAALALVAAALHLTDRRGSEDALRELEHALCDRPLPESLVAALAEVDSEGTRTQSSAPELFAQWVSGPGEGRCRVLYDLREGIQEQSWGANQLGRPWGMPLDELARHMQASRCSAERDGPTLRVFRPHRTPGGTRVLLLLEHMRQ